MNMRRHPACKVKYLKQNPLFQCLFLADIIASIIHMVVCCCSTPGYISVWASIFSFIPGNL